MTGKINLHDYYFFEIIFTVYLQVLLEFKNIQDIFAEAEFLLQGFYKKIVCNDCCMYNISI